MKQYKIIEDDNLYTLEDHINDAAKDGYEVEKISQIVIGTHDSAQYIVTTVIMSKLKD